MYGLNPLQVVRKGFTLIELLVVVAIIALLVAILVPSLDMARESAQGVVCSSNQRQIGLAINMYLNDSNDRFPMPVAADYKGMTYYGSYLSNAKGVLICPADDYQNSEISYAISQWTFQGNEWFGYSNPLDIKSVYRPSDVMLLWAFWYNDVAVVHADAWPYLGGLASVWSQRPMSIAHLGGSNVLFMDFHVEYCKWDPDQAGWFFYWPAHNITTFPYDSNWRYY